MLPGHKNEYMSEEHSMYILEMGERYGILDIDPNNKKCFKLDKRYHAILQSCMLQTFDMKTAINNSLKSYCSEASYTEISFMGATVYEYLMMAAEEMIKMFGMNKRGSKGFDSIDNIKDMIDSMIKKNKER